MKNSIITISLILAFTISNAQDVVRLYKTKAPGSENWTQKESEFTYPMLNGLLVRNVTDPSLTIFKPAKPNGTAIVVCPGGGFQWLSWQSEGTDVAKWLIAKGVTVFVLKYRIMNTGETIANFEKSYTMITNMMGASPKKSPDSSQSPDPKLMNEFMNITALAIADGIQAMKYIKQHAAEYSINTNKIGVIGFSAGTAIAQGVSMNSDKTVVPNFAGIIYGGQPMQQKIPDNSPSLFILSAADDMISASNTDLYKQWITAGKQAELHIYSKGGHGFGMKKQGLPVDGWIERFGDWLKVQGFLK